MLNFAPSFNLFLLYAFLIIGFPFPSFSQNIQQFSFNEEALSEAGFEVFPANGMNRSEVFLGPIPVDELGREWSDGRGLQFLLEPGEGSIIFGPIIETDSSPVLIRVSVRVDKAGASLFAGAFDADYSGSLGLNQLLEGDFMVDQYVRFRSLYRPQTGRLVPFYQAAHNGQMGETISVFIDNMEVIPITDTMIPADDLSHSIRDLLNMDLNAATLPGSGNRTLIPFDGGTISELGFIENSSTGFASGRYQLGPVPSDASGLYSDGMGLNVTVALRQGSLFFGPYISAVSRPVMIRASVRSSGPGAWLFLGGLNAWRERDVQHLDGSLAYGSYFKSEEFADDYQRVVCWYTPPRNGIVPFFQVAHGGDPQYANVTVSFDNLEIIPLTDTEIPLSMTNVRELLGVEETFSFTEEQESILDPEAPEIELYNPPANTTNT
ncbi:MAG: hypothetical protein ACP5I1_19110, partial [Candidatus Hinthialibacter sp.]